MSLPKKASVGNAAKGQTHILRIMKDLREFYTENPNSMHVVAEEEDVTKVHALIRGPEKTPYHNGFFYFVFKFPESYPLRPPKVKLITTGGGTVSFNPNLYSSGKVCLSILGTWSGPEWSACQTLFTTMLSIQSLMNEMPYYNEPGYEHYKGQKEYCKSSDNYNKMLVHETLRVAVIGMLDERGVDSQNMPQELKDVMIDFFKKNYKFYEDLIRAHMGTDSGQSSDRHIVDPLLGFAFYRTNYQYDELLVKLQRLKSLHGICDKEVTAEESTSGQEQQQPVAQESLRSDDIVESYKTIADKILTEVKPSEVKQSDEGTWDDIDWDDSDAEDLESYEEEDEESDDDDHGNGGGKIATDLDHELEEGEIIDEDVTECDKNVCTDETRDEEVDLFVDHMLDQMMD